MPERQISIKFGTVYKPKDRINPATKTPYPKYQKYIITELMEGDKIGSNWLDETGSIPRLDNGGTHFVSDVVELLGEMSFDQVLEVARSGGWLDSETEELFKKEARKTPRNIRITE